MSTIHIYLVGLTDWWLGINQNYEINYSTLPPAYRKFYFGAVSL